MGKFVHGQKHRQPVTVGVVLLIFNERHSMNRNLRWILIVANAAAACGVLFFCNSRAEALPSDLSLPIAVEQQWIIGLLILYGLNALASWRFRDSYPVAAARMLIFAVAAFAVVSHATDILSEHRALLPQVFAPPASPADALLVSQLEARLAASAAMLTLCLTGIAVGFESKAE